MKQKIVPKKCSPKVQNLTVFNYFHIRVRLLGPGELIQNGFSGAR